jgi:hypothetical protein
MSGLVIVAGLLVLAALAPRYGADSRDGRDWSGGHGRVVRRPHRVATPASDLRALLALAHRVAGWIRGGRGRRAARRSRPRTVGGPA